MTYWTVSADGPKRKYEGHTAVAGDRIVIPIDDDSDLTIAEQIDVALGVKYTESIPLEHVWTVKDIEQLRDAPTDQQPALRTALLAKLDQALNE